MLKKSFFMFENWRFQNFESPWFDKDACLIFGGTQQNPSLVMQFWPRERIVNPAELGYLKTNTK